MVFDHVKMDEVDSVIRILSEARARIGGLGIDQWQSGYPSREVVVEDIALSRSFAARDEDGSLCGVFAVIEDGEPTYDKIYDGAWLTEGMPYLAVHRVAVASDKLRRGVASGIMRYAEQRAETLGMASVRIDTHEGNIPMRGMLERGGYVYCGSIYLAGGEHRVAYEKRLK